MTARVREQASIVPIPLEAQATYEPDGSWVVVVSARRPAHPNWVSTAGHRTGRIWFRWFLPERTPEQPRVEVLPVATV